MKHRSPLVTLLASAAVLGVLLVVNLTQTSVDSPGGSPPGSPPPASTPSPTGLPPVKTPATPPGADPTTQPTRPTQPPGFPAEVMYAGRTAGREATIAIAVKNGNAAAYICDGRSVESWLTGTAAAGTVSLRSKRGDTVQARLADGSLTGVADLGGRTLRFTIGAAGPPAGLYRGQAAVDGRPTTIGWIILPDGSQVGIRTSGGVRNAAPPLDPDQGGVVLDGTRVPARPVTGATTF